VPTSSTAPQSHTSERCHDLPMTSSRLHTLAMLPSHPPAGRLCSGWKPAPATYNEICNQNDFSDEDSSAEPNHGRIAVWPAVPYLSNTDANAIRAEIAQAQDATPVSCTTTRWPSVFACKDHTTNLQRTQQFAADQHPRDHLLTTMIWTALLGQFWRMSRNLFRWSKPLRYMPSGTLRASQSSQQSRYGHTSSIGAEYICSTIP
jgi:hypothetical protein